MKVKNQISPEMAKWPLLDKKTELTRGKHFVPPEDRPDREVFPDATLLTPRGVIRIGMYTEGRFTWDYRNALEDLALAALGNNPSAIDEAARKYRELWERHFPPLSPAN